MKYILLAPEMMNMYLKQEIENLEAHLNTLDINSRVEIYPGTAHGFTFPEGSEEYDEQATERHWKEILQMFGRKL